MAIFSPMRAPWGEYVGIGQMTVEAFDQLHMQDGWQFELHEGSLIRMPGPGKEHGKIQSRFLRTLDRFLEAQGLGMLTSTSCFNLPLPGNQEELLCPDLSYTLPDREAVMPQRGSYPIGAPDLVIEIASPNDYRPQMQSKAQIYLQAGVRLVWIVWPNTQTIDVWRPLSVIAPTATLNVADRVDGADVVPGFTCLVQLIFND
jgi:Uma2 family endonuclease